ncbi:MAG: MBL fold metallo-hydrolase [Phycisphaeraceae bacterium]
MSDALTIQRFALGDFMTNCYVVHGESKTCWLVDVGDNPAAMLDYLEQHELTPERIILTHAHADHVAGVREASERWPDAEILIHEAERDFLADPELNLSAAIGASVTAPGATNLLRHEDTLSFEGRDFQVRHTPGHSPGGITIYSAREGVAFVGDAIFAGSIGRYDFPTSDGPTLLRAIREQILTLPDDTRLLPGHGPETTVGQEKVTNPFVQ